MSTLNNSFLTYSTQTHTDTHVYGDVSHSSVNPTSDKPQKYFNLHYTFIDCGKKETFNTHPSITRSFVNNLLDFYASACQCTTQKSQI